MRGHIRRRSKSSWAVLLDLGRDPVTGKRRRRWHSVKGTKREAERVRTELLHRLDHGGYVEPSRTTTGEFLERWLADYAEPNVAPSTLRRYRTVVKRHLIPAFGHLAVGEIRPDHIVAAHRHWRTRGRIDGSGGLAPYSVLYNHSVLHEALSRAVRWRIIVVNPADAVDPPRARRREFQVLTRPQLRALISAASDRSMGPVVHLAALTGMRQAECLGTRWSDIDLNGGTLHVTQTVQWIARKGFVFQPPKTDRARRAISLSQAAVDLLRGVRARQAEHRLKLGPAYRDFGLTFTVGDGGPINARNLHRAFKGMLRAADLPDSRFHDLRHTHATVLLEQGVHPKIVSERLGHASVAITLDTYSHVLPGLQRSVAERLDEWIAADPEGNELHA